MQPGSYKICPQCQTPAYLNAPQCTQCGRQYRTQYADQTQVVSPYAGVAPAATPVRQLEQPLQITGAALMILGVFCPVFGAPLGGSVSWIGLAPTLGILAIVLSCITLVSSLASRYTAARVAAGLYSLFLFFVLGTTLGTFTTSGKEAAFAIQMQWGWVPLFVGCLLVLFAPKTHSDPDSSLVNSLPAVFLVFSILAGIGGYELVLSEVAQKEEDARQREIKIQRQEEAERRQQQEYMREFQNQQRTSDQDFRRMITPPRMQNPRNGEIRPLVPQVQPTRLPGFQRQPQRNYRPPDSLGNFNS